MRVRDLRIALEEMRTIFKSANARPQEKAFEQIASAVSAHDDEPVELYFSNVRRSAERIAVPLDRQYAERLEEAGLSEAAFLKLLDEMKADKRLKKPSLQKIAKAYAGAFDKRATAAGLIDEIKLAFYTKVYDRDARGMAKRATPV